MDLHPDKYSGNEKDVTLARELSGRINGAYEILRDPLKRAEYLVRLLPRYHVNDKADTASYQLVNLKSQRLNR
jgi:curved DNA-binding protein CbpA